MSKMIRNISWFTAVLVACLFSMFAAGGAQAQLALTSVSGASVQDGG